ncbi:MAG: hypothetical protein ACM3ML_31810 [Micromonosporaceae bacterium]
MIGPGPGAINVFAQRWLHRLPLPFGPKDRDAGYWWDISMRQVEISRTIVFGAPRHARLPNVGGTSGQGPCLQPADTGR